ncbi:MAG: hypothetical protein JWO13_3425 [Acidobacteriales bacterium]|nr:hypothetical protein [Terriglobales bacterium]
MRLNRFLICVIVTVATASTSPLVTKASAAGAHDRWGSEMNVKDSEVIRKSFPLNGSGQKAIEIDNVFGSIEVVAGTSNEVQVVVTKTLHAETAAKLETARKEVTLDITQQDNSVKLYVNGPFRCNCNNGRGDWGGNNNNHDPGSMVEMDFQIQVPSNTDLKLATVNNGHIKVQNVSGEYYVNNVNGGIEMNNVAGSGKVRTVNGGVKVSFRENPRADSEYASLNGNVELYFVQNLSADFRFKTFNGGIHSDFPLTALPNRPATEERRDGKFIFRSDRYTGGRVGSGGPEIKVENFNGEIRVLERHV